MNEELTPYKKSLLPGNFNIRDEVYKFILIVEAAKKPIYRSYILEKLRRIFNGVPITLDGLKQRQFNEYKESRWFKPLPRDHPMVGDPEQKCPVCREMFKEKDVVGLIPVQRWGDEGPGDLNVRAIPVHKDCYEPVGLPRAR